MQYAFGELVERILGDLFLIVLGFKISARKQTDQILQLASRKHMYERHAQHIFI